MSTKELIEEVKFGIKDKRLLEATSIGAVGVDGKLIAIKSRYGKQKTEELLKDKDKFVSLDESSSFEYNPDHTFVVYDRSLFNLRGAEALDELVLRKESFYKER